MLGKRHYPRLKVPELLEYWREVIHDALNPRLEEGQRQVLVKPGLSLYEILTVLIVQ